MSLSTLGRRTIAGETFTCSEWTAGHLEATIADLRARYPRCRLEIIQPCFRSLVPGGGADLSEGTHDFDGVFDVRVLGMDWDKAQSYLRGQGWAAWHRTPAQGFSDHIHMATIPRGLSGRPTAEQVGRAYAVLGLKVGKYIDGGWTSSSPHRITATCQIADYFAHTFGLANNHRPGADKSWFPADIASTIYKPTTARKEAAVTPKAPVASMYAQITSLSNQILDATDPENPAHVTAAKIRDLSHKYDGIKR